MGKRFYVDTPFRGASRTIHDFQVRDLVKVLSFPPDRGIEGFTGMVVRVASRPKRNRAYMSDGFVQVVFDQPSRSGIDRLFWSLFPFEVEKIGKVPTEDPPMLGPFLEGVNKRLDGRPGGRGARIRRVQSTTE